MTRKHTKKITAQRIEYIDKAIKRAEKNATRQRNLRLHKYVRVRAEFWEQVIRDYKAELKTLQDENIIRR